MFGKLEISLGSNICRIEIDLSFEKIFSHCSGHYSQSFWRIMHFFGWNHSGLFCSDIQLQVGLPTSLMRYAFEIEKESIGSLPTVMAKG